MDRQLQFIHLELIDSLTEKACMKLLFLIPRSLRVMLVFSPPFSTGPTEKGPLHYVHLTLVILQQPVRKQKCVRNPTNARRPCCVTSLDPTIWKSCPGSPGSREENMSNNITVTAERAYTGRQEPSFNYVFLPQIPEEAGVEADTL